MLVIGFRFTLRALTCLAILSLGKSLAADGTLPLALPAWPDQSPSVYAANRVETAHEQFPSTSSALPLEPVSLATLASPPVVMPVVPATHVIEAPADDPRRLTPSRERRLPPAANRNGSEQAVESLLSFGMPLDSIYTTATALAVVLGLLLLCTGLIRRGSKRSNAALPNEVVSVLGRVSLAPRQFAELIRVGNKLVLVSVTQNGAEPLTEITDPVEIDRLVGLCQARSQGSSTVEFDQVFRNLAEEKALAGFVGNELPRFESRLAPPADLFAAYRGGEQIG